MYRTLTLRNVPDKVVKQLRRRAARNKRSMQEELLAIVQDAVVDRASLARQLEACRESLLTPLSLEEIHQAIEAGRR
ncbi:MAG: hypothetical protein DRI34_02970 [Deltaproteobacteria bacterium]|nr:MAG: hypothetical protein DRI34_02970 [Deltaproteobacteria bacterium]